MSLSFSSLFSISRVEIFAENSVLDRCVLRHLEMKYKKLPYFFEKTLSCLSLN